MVEFAIVGPLFIMIMLGLIQVCIWFWNAETLSVAARETARGAVIGVAEGDPQSAGAAELSRLLAGKVMVVTPAYTVATTSVANGGAGVFDDPNGGSCLAVRNAPIGGVYARLGWDWLCLGFRSFPADEPLRVEFPRSNTALEAAREALLAGMGSGIRQIYGADGSGVLWLGPHGKTTVAACYVAIASDGSELCLYELSATVSENGIFDPTAVTETVNLVSTTTIAPVLVRVKVTASAPVLLGISLFDPLGVALEGSGTTWLDRYRPVCPAPRSSGEYVTGACGGVH